MNSSGLLVLSCALVVLMAGESDAQTTPTPSPEQVLARLRRGGEHTGNDEDSFVVGDALRPNSLALLTAELRRSSGDAREEFAYLLVGVLRRVDPLRSRGGNAIQDPTHVALLVDPCLQQRGGAREVCLGALLNSVPTPLLQPHGPALLTLLQREPDPTTALVVSRARPAGGLAVVQRIARGRVYARSREFLVAQAALGDTASEEQLVREFQATQDETLFRSRARELAIAQTPATLRALGLALRTPLLGSIGRGRISLRLAVLDALRIAFPTEPVLFSHLVRTERDYEAAERFAETRLGVRFTAPRPPFLVSEPGPA